MIIARLSQRTAERVDIVALSFNERPQSINSLLKSNYFILRNIFVRGIIARDICHFITLSFCQADLAAGAKCKRSAEQRIKSNPH